MGKMNMKLMQGIGETEGLFQKEKQPDTNEVPAAKKEQNDMKPEGEKNAPSDADQKASTVTQKTEAVRRKTRTKKKAENQEQVFSFRATVDDINLWKSYKTAVGETMENIGTAAMNEYIKHHKLSGAELTVFEALLAREKK